MTDLTIRVLLCAAVNNTYTNIHIIYVFTFIYFIFIYLFTFIYNTDWTLIDTMGHKYP